MDLHYIVDCLNSAPFEYNLSLLSFSEKNSPELLQLVSDVFSTISPKSQKIDISKEDPDQTVDRLISFLKMVKYKPTLDPASFRQLLGSADKDVIYHVLKWVLSQTAHLEKRAFVGYYLSFPDMPEEFNFDPDIMELKDEIKNLQAQFIETHKANETVKSLNRDTQALKARIKSLEEEKERLGEKVDRAHKQVEKVPDRQNYMDVCSSLRKQQDEEVNLSMSLQTQKLQLEKTAGSYHKVSARLKEMSSSYQEGSGSKLLQSLNEDVNNLRAQVNERYPKELERRQKRLQALQDAFSNGVNTEMDLQRLQAQANTLHTQIGEIQERQAAQNKSRAGDKSFMQLRQAQSMATVVGRKKDEMNSKMERLQEKKSSLQSQYEKLTVDGSGNAVVSDEDWRVKYEGLKANLPQYKKMKKDLGDIEAEVFVLAYTEELLQSQESALTEEAGCHEEKSVLDEAKGMTLSEISRTVEEINASINDRKLRLAPQIKKLRTVRQQFSVGATVIGMGGEGGAECKLRLVPQIKKLRTVRQQFSELESDHNGRKQTYDAAMSQFQSRTATLEAEVSTLRNDVMDSEAKYHLLHCQLTITDQNIRKVQSGPSAESLKDKYSQKVAEAEDQTRHLKEKQREMKLLQLKLDVTRKEMGLAPASAKSPTQHNFSAEAVGPRGGMEVGPLRTGRVGLNPVVGSPGGGGAIGPGGANVMTF
eukprot:gene15561-21655_t